MCYNKYNTSSTPLLDNEIEMSKYKCAISCYSPELPDFVLQHKDKELCSLLEYGPEEHVSSNLSSIALICVLNNFIQFYRGIE